MSVCTAADLNTARLSLHPILHRAGGGKRESGGLTASEDNEDVGNARARVSVVNGWASKLAFLHFKGLKATVRAESSLGLAKANGLRRVRAVRARSHHFAGAATTQPPYLNPLL